MTKKFQRNIENFTCEKCGQRVVGTGYTNHCPNCLWSKHVDVNPGDRVADCNGLMEPIGLIIRRGKKLIVHRCLSCDYEKVNSVQQNDNQELIIKLSAQPVTLKK